MRRSLVVLIVMCMTPATAGAAAQQQPLPPIPSATLDVNVVFIGFKQKQYFGHESEPNDPQAIYSDVLDPVFLPHTDDPIITRGGFSYPDQVSADNHLDFHNHIAFAPKKLESAFFDELTRIGRPAPLTKGQEFYNAANTNVLDVTGRPLLIPGPAVERWLEAYVGNVPGTVPGGHTIVFINWFGKPGFRFHAYQGTGRDPNTGQDQRDSTFAGSAWGGSTGDLWFYDMSAGPDAYNYDADFGWDFQIAPAWEMTPGADGFFADATDVAGQLARVELYTHAGQSPTYDPLVSAPLAGGARVVRWNLFDGNPSIPQSAYFTPSYSENAIHDLQPYFPVTSTIDRFPWTGEDRTAYEIFANYLNGLPGAPGCWQTYGARFEGEEMSCYIAQNQDRFARAAGPRDKVIPVMAYNVPSQEGLSYGGIAWPYDDGRPAGVFGAGAPWLYDSDPYYPLVHPGFALSTVLQHEIGHYVGLSHPHNGYDSEGGFQFSANLNGPWLGTLDECQCPMGYTFKGLPFGVFDHDSIDRNLAGRYYATAYRALGQLDARTATAVQNTLRTSLASFRQTNWRNAVIRARQAYELALGALPPAAAASVAGSDVAPAQAPTPGLETLNDPRDGGKPVTQIPLPDNPAAKAYAHSRMPPPSG